jgi:hypothetical protein
VSNTDNDPATIEQIYDAAVAEEKLKHGTKFERLAAIVFQVLEADATVELDLRLRGDGKRTTHQIDVRITRAGRTRRVLVECKDKTTTKVDLEEARSFATVMRHLDADGVMITTTGFTQGAADLADDEGIELFTLRPFLSQDREGRIMQISIAVTAVLPVPDSVAVSSGPGESEFEEGNHSVELSAPIVTGSSMRDMRELLGSLMESPLDPPYPQGPQESIRDFDPPVVFDVSGRHLAVRQICVKYHVEISKLEVSANAGNRIATLILRSLDGSIDRVIWNDQLGMYIVDPLTGLLSGRE